MGNDDSSEARPTRAEPTEDTVRAPSEHDTPAPPPAVSGPHPQPGESIGPYVLIDRLGAGAYGEVWKAEQKEPVRRVVAIKILNAGMNSTVVVARFRAEQQALAMMDHPGIAKVHDAGLAPSGLPYFVMQYIKGATLLAHCDREKLTLKQRLELFASICDAVHHAHQKGIIHRDLKPSNIMVTTLDTGEARPVVVDFGIAKATSEPLVDETVHSAIGRPQGTWAYMSPEQADGRPDVDTTSDVYSLGVVLYELLSGIRPFDDEAFRKAGEEARRRVIREEDPPPPGAKLDADQTGTGTRSAQNRRTNARELARTLRGELSWIPLYAMRKERDRRYTSAAAFAGDIRAFLAHRPLIAGPESTAYRLGKYVRRHRVPVVAGALLVTTLLAGIAGTTWGLLAARANARQEAKARARAEEVVAFVTTSLQSGDPSQGGRESLTVIEAMDAAIRELRAGRFGEDPETAAQLLMTIAEVLRNNGRAAEAETHFAEALEIRSRLAPGDDPSVATSLDGLGLSLRTLGRLPEAEARLSEALAMRQRLLPPENPSIAASLNNVALVRRSLGRPEEAESLIRQALAINRRAYPGDHVETASTLGNLANLLQGLHRFEEAESLANESIAMLRRCLPGDHPIVATALNNRAFLLRELGRFSEAEPAFVEALEVLRRIYRGDHPTVGVALMNLSLARSELGRVEEAEPLAAEANAMFRRLFPSDHPTLAQSCSQLGLLRLRLGRADEACTLLDEALAMRRRLTPEGSADLAESLNNVALARERTGHAAEAEPLYAEALAMRRAIYQGRDSKELAQSLNNLAGVRVRLGREADAEPLVAEALEIYRRVYTKGHPNLAVALTNLARLRQRLGRPGESAPLLREALAMRRGFGESQLLDVAETLAALASVERALGRSAEAVTAADEALTIASRLLAEDHPIRKAYTELLATCRKAEGS